MGSNPTSSTHGPVGGRGEGSFESGSVSLLTHSRFLFKPTAPRSWRMPHLWTLCGDGAVCPFARPRLLSFSGGGKTMAGFVGVSYRAGAAFRFICCRRLVRATLCSCGAGTTFRMAFSWHPLRAGVCVWRPWYARAAAVTHVLRRLPYDLPAAAARRTSETYCRIRAKYWPSGCCLQKIDYLCNRLI